MENDYQAVIIGGGPAGLSAGILLAQAGLRILLVEQKFLPVEKCCGEGVLPLGVRNLAYLVVTKYLHEGDYFPFRGVRYISSTGRTAMGYFREGIGWGIPRLNLSTAMQNRAADMEGLTISQGLKVTAYQRLEDRMSVEIGGQTVTARLLIGADGLNSSIRRWAGLDGVNKGLKRWGARLHYECVPWSDCVEVYWGDGLEAYVTPCGPTMISVAYLWDSNRYRPERAGRDLADSLLEKFPALRERLEGAEACGPALTLGPLRRVVRSPVADGVALVGDASGYLDPITGEGINLAMAQAIALAQIVPRLLKQSKGNTFLRAEVLKSYASAHRVASRPNQLTTKLALALGRFSGGFELVMRIMERSPGLFQSLLSVNMGNTKFI